MGDDRELQQFLYLHDKHSRLEERAYSRRRDGINSKNMTI